MWNNIRIVIGVTTFLMLIGCNYKQQESTSIELESIQKQNSQKDQPKTQWLDNNREQLSLLPSEYIIDSIFRRIGDYSPSELLMRKSLFETYGYGPIGGTLLLKNYSIQDRTFTTVDNYTYINNNLLLRRVDLAATRKNHKGIDRAYEGKYRGFSMPYYKTYIKKEKWDAIGSTIKAFGWVHFDYAEYWSNSEPLGQDRILPITTNTKVKDLLRKGVLSCYYYNGDLVLFEYYDRLFDPSSDSTFYFEFLVQEPYLYIQKVPNLTVTLISRPGQSSNIPIITSTDCQGLLYEHKQLIGRTSAEHIQFNKSTTKKEENIEAQLLITDFYEPLIDFIQETNKQYK